MTVDLDGSWRMQVSLNVRGTSLNPRMGVHETLWDNYSRYAHVFLHVCIFRLCVFVFMQMHSGSCERVGE